MQDNLQLNQVHNLIFYFKIQIKKVYKVIELKLNKWKIRIFRDLVISKKQKL